MRPHPAPPRRPHTRAGALALTLLGLLTGACDDGAGSVDPGDAVIDAALDAAPDLTPDAAPDATPAPAFCDGATAQRYDPFGSTEVEVFPDDLLTRPDPASPTGLRLDPTRAPWLDAMPRLMQETLAEMDALSGFGHNGAIVLRFDAPLAPYGGDIDGSTADPALMLFDLDADPPARIPYSVAQSEGGAALIVQPERPLRGGARHGLVLTADYGDADGGCVRPSPALQALLTGGGDDPALTALAPAYAALLDAAGLDPIAVGAATVFTTHDDTAVLQTIAAGLDAYPARWVAAPTCEGSRWGRRCTGWAELWDFRDDRAVLTPEPVARWTVPVRFDLPEEPGAPIILMGHGIGSDRDEANRVARVWTPAGAAVVALDAVRHGEHPTADPDEPLETRIIGFLGLDLGRLRIDGRTLTGHFDQTTLDRLQLLDLLRREPDVDGDGVDDLDPTRVAYIGISLGGLFGPALLALDPDIDLGVLQVPGGHLARFATSSEPVEQFKPVVINLFGSEDRFERLLPLLQAAVDRADPATWAPLAMRRAGGPPHLLMQVSTFDEIVPPVTGLALARALDLPHIGEIIEPVALLETQDAPAQLNLPGGAASGGFTQFDRVGDDAAPRASGHHSTPDSAQAQQQVRAFVGPWMEGGTPVVVDAYAERETAPLP